VFPFLLIATQPWTIFGRRHAGGLVGPHSGMPMGPQTSVSRGECSGGAKNPSKTYMGTYDIWVKINKYMDRRCNKCAEIIGEIGRIKCLPCAGHQSTRQNVYMPCAFLESSRQTVGTDIFQILNICAAIILNLRGNICHDGGKLQTQQFTVRGCKAHGKRRPSG
jgi:hypothetical protein